MGLGTALCRVLSRRTGPQGAPFGDNAHQVRGFGAVARFTPSMVQPLLPGPHQRLHFPASPVLHSTENDRLDSTGFVHSQHCVGLRTTRFLIRFGGLLCGFLRAEASLLPRRRSLIYCCCFLEAHLLELQGSVVPDLLHQPPITASNGFYSSHSAPPPAASDRQSEASRARSRTPNHDVLRIRVVRKPPHNAGVHKPVESRRSFFCGMSARGKQGKCRPLMRRQWDEGEKRCAANRQMLGVPKGSLAVLFLDQDAAQTRLQGIRQRDALDVGAFAAPAAQSTPSALAGARLEGEPPVGPPRGEGRCRTRRAWGRASRSRAVESGACRFVGVGCDLTPETAAWRLPVVTVARAQQAVIPGLCQRGQAGRVAATADACRGRDRAALDGPGLASGLAGDLAIGALRRRWWRMATRQMSGATSVSGG